MKTLLLFILTIIFVSCSTDSSPENKQKESLKIVNKTTVKDSLLVSQFTVWGNCEMCKETIEKSVDTIGVKSARWDVDKKLMTISYDTSKINLQTIQQLIASSGYDNVAISGDDIAYKKLHACCQYDRK